MFQESLAGKSQFPSRTALNTYLLRIFARFLEIQLTAQHVIFNALIPLAQQSINEQELAKSGHTVPEHVSPDN